MGQREAQTVLSRLTENRGKTLGHEILELIDGEVEIDPLWLENCRAFERGCLKPGDQEGAHQVRLVRSQDPFGKVGNEDTLVIDDKIEVQLPVKLAQNIAYR